MRKTLFTFLFSLSFCALLAQKQVYIPVAFSNDPALKSWSWDKSYQSENFVVFWGPVVGTDPANYSVPDLRFNPKAVCDTLEKCYVKFVKEIKFCSDDTSKNLGKYKIIIVMNDTWGEGGPAGWAFGGGYEGVIGAMWVHPNATRDGAVISHELTHSLQAMIPIQENPNFAFAGNDYTGFFWEGHANYMRTQMYPKFAGDDMPRWMATSSFHWSSTRHHYANFRLLIHLQHTDGINMVNRLWKESDKNIHGNGEHPLETLTRLKGWSQNQLNDFIYDYAKREVVADYPVNNFGSIIREARHKLQRDEPHYMWRFHTILKKVSDSLGRYVVPDEFAPQDYGFNLIPLYPTSSDRSVRIKFKGHTEVNSTAGWRYGFVAVKGDGGSARYGEFYNQNESIIDFKLNSDETALYLVVVGAPTTHTNYNWEPGWPKIKRYPYELLIEKALPEGYQPDFRSVYKINGHIHPNGGGWVANTATVDPSVFIGPSAIVLGTSKITGSVRIDGTAWVENATVSDSVTIYGNANIWNGAYSGFAKVSDNAVLSFCTLSDRAVAKGNTMEWGATLGGSVVMGGDSENGNCDNGYYLQVSECNGKTAEDPSNQDVNTPYSLFTDAQMLNTDLKAPTAPSKFKASLISTSGAFLSWFPSMDSQTGVANYTIYMGATELVTTKSTFYYVTKLDPGTTYTFSVKATDKAGNVSEASNIITPSTKGNPCTSLFPFTESFEKGWGVFSVNEIFGAEWKRKKNGAADGKYFAHINSSLRNCFKVVDLTSHCFDFRDTYKPVLEFKYQMNGVKKGSLKMQIRSVTDTSWTTLWSTEANEGNNWNKVAVDLQAYVNKSNVKIRFRGTAGIQGTIGVDDIKVTVSPQNISTLASVTTSHVSPWESLAAVNDTLLPVNSRDRSQPVYGNWDGEANYNKWNWVQYDWTRNYEIEQTNIYWFLDDGGILEPDSAYIEYWKDNAWVYGGSLGDSLDQFNHLKTDFVTNKLRVNFIGQAATGILEWEVWGKASQVSSTSALSSSSAQRIIVQEENSLKPYLIYPNPFTEWLTIKVEASERAEVLISDLSGRKVYNKSFQKTHHIYRSSIGSDGVYILKLRTGNKNYTEKIIVK